MNRMMGRKAPDNSTFKVKKRLSGNTVMTLREHESADGKTAKTFRDGLKINSKGKVLRSRPLKTSSYASKPSK